MAVLAGKPLKPAYDFIVAGGGAAGCVLARRLAEDRSADVLLIEAGPDCAGIEAIRNAGQWAGLMGGRYDWGYSYAPNPHVAGRAIAIPRGKVLGGSSSTNAMLWYRGHASDYDAWARLGAQGWNYEAVLPYFRRCEDWEGGASAYRGAGGPMRIECPAHPHPLAFAMLEGASELGLPVIADANAETNDGATIANYNMRGNERWSTARGYLEPVSGWPNLTILTDSLATQLCFAGNRCTGVEHLVDGVLIRTRADRETVLTLGAIGTPVLLMLSGLGDPDELNTLGIPVRVALPGVGQNLQDHPLLAGINFAARVPLGPVAGNGGGSMMNWCSEAGLAGPDLHAFVVQNAGTRRDIPGGTGEAQDVFALTPGLMRSESRGRLRLLEAKPGGRLSIDPNFLAEPGDLVALIRGYDMMMELAATKAYRGLAILPDATRSKSGKIAFVRQNCSTFFHTCGTCAMGQDEAAVTDPQLRVRGVEGLRIADASVIPKIPSCNTQAPVVMIAERAAGLIKGLAS